MEIIFCAPTVKLAVFMGSKIVDQMVGALSVVSPGNSTDAVAALLDLGFSPPAVQRLGPLAISFSGIGPPTPIQATAWREHTHEVSQ